MRYLLFVLLVIGCAAETDTVDDRGDSGYEALETDSSIGYHVSGYHVSMSPHTRVHEIASDAAEEPPTEASDASTADAAEEPPSGDPDASTADAAEEPPSGDPDASTVDAAEEPPTEASDASTVDAAEEPPIGSCDITGSWSIRIVTYSMWCFSTDAPILLELSGYAPACSLSGTREFNLPNTGFGTFTGDMTYQLDFDDRTVTGTAEITGWILGSAIGPCETHLTLQGQRVAQ